MPERGNNRSHRANSKEQSRELVRKIGEMDPYADSDPAEVEDRIRNMHYGATHPRVTELRRKQAPED